MNRTFAGVLCFCIAGLLTIPAGAGAELAADPARYGTVIIRNHAESAGMAAVTFDHWLHRSRYTCRLCHIDIGFAMQAGATGITAEMNRGGFYCGACHNGGSEFEGKKIFSSCSSREDSRLEAGVCGRCHGAVERQYDYANFSRDYPKHPGDGLIDWEKAEHRRFLTDYLRGVSISRRQLKPQKDFSIASKSSWLRMPDIIFSHRKHAVWNGCEVCHPEIFPSAKKGATKYTMFDISRGQYCGLCHGRVAFPVSYCGRCHGGRR